MKKLTLSLLMLVTFVSLSFAQSNILVVDYNNLFSSDQSNNNSNIYNRLLATQTSVVRVGAIPATINIATYDQVWIFGNMGNPGPANLNPVVNFMNAGGAVYVQSEVSCCNIPADYVDALINATVTAGGSITHSTTKSGYFQTGPSASPCSPTPPNWVTHGAAARPFQGTPAVNVFLEANTVCGGAIGPGDVIGVQFRACDMISGSGALMSIGDFNVFPTAGACATVGILGTANDNTVIDYIANLLPTLLSCTPISTTTMVPTNDTTLCDGGQIPGYNFISNPTGATFAWTNSNAAIGLGANGTGNIPTFTAANNTGAPITGMIIVTPTLNGCPGVPDTFNITVNPPPTVNAGIDTTVCVGDPAGIGGAPSATGGAGGPYNYSWTPTAGVSSATNANPTATPSAIGNTTYTLQVTDGGGCIGYDSVVVTGISCCAVNIVDTTITDASCNGLCDGSVQITANGGATQFSIDGINWFPSNTFNNLCPGQYTVYASNGSCADSIVITITEPTALSMTGVVTDVTCFGGSDGQLTVTPGGGTPPYSYSWTAGSGGNNPTSTGLSAGQVTVTITDFNGCQLDSTFVIGEPASLNFVTFDGDTLAGCAPHQVDFNNTTNPSLFTSILWEFSNGDTSTMNPASTTFNTPGSYNVKLTVTDAAGCKGVTEKIGYITVYDDPTAHFTATPGHATVFDPTFNFIDLSTYNIVSWDWNFNNLGTSFIQNPTFTFPDDTGSHNVTLIVEDNHGCIDTVNYTVSVKGQHAVFVPNAFTPDFDGQNDGFHPKGFGISEAGYTFMIFNRWGEKLFEATDINDAWYGVYKDQLVPVGVYVWKLDFLDLNGHGHTETGKVHVIR
jgi:gliding motility-associated-like protein